MTLFSQREQNPDTRARNCIESKDLGFESKKKNVLRETLFFLRKCFHTDSKKYIFESLKKYFEIDFLFSEIILKNFKFIFFYVL